MKLESSIIIVRFLSDSRQIPVRFPSDYRQIPVRLPSDFCQIPVRFLSDSHQILVTMIFFKTVVTYSNSPQPRRLKAFSVLFFLLPTKGNFNGSQDICGLNLSSEGQFVLEYQKQRRLKQTSPIIFLLFFFTMKIEKKKLKLTVFRKRNKY